MKFFLCVLCCLFLLSALYPGQTTFADETAAEKCNLTSIAGQCAQCKMDLPADGPPLGAYTRGSVPEWSFMDLGCLLRWRDSKCMPTQVDLDAHLYVRDYGSGAEVEAVKAFYVVHAGVATPMGSGIVAFKDRSSAAAFVEQHGGASVMDYEGLVNSDIASVCDG